MVIAEAKSNCAVDAVAEKTVTEKAVLEKDSNSESKEKFALQVQ